MTDYKHTLNLPQTDFPMKAGLAQREPEALARWEKINLYQQRAEHAKGRNKFILHDGPPYANGNIHLGHAVNKTLKDMVCRAKYLSGFDTPYVPGWDCHGLPIEINVEKKIGKAGVKVSAKEFRKACREYAAEQVTKQKADFKRLGILGNWDNPYLTMDYKFEANIIRTLKEIVAHGHLQQGVKPVYWCFDCGSSLAEAEVEYKDKQSPSIDVKFSIAISVSIKGIFAPPIMTNGVIKANPIWDEIPDSSLISLIIWTTTPWTLPANRAVAVHPELEYALVQLDDEQIIIAKDLVTQVMERYGHKDYKIIASCKGAALKELQLQHPFYDRIVPVVLGDHVTVDAGTGAVHTAPSHGEDDFRMGKQYNLPMDFYVQGNGVFAPEVEFFAGEFVWKANQKVIDLLKEKNKLLHSATINHSYPHCWRHKTPLIFRATPQWFISMTKNNLLADAIQALPTIQWVPKWGEERMRKMLEGRPDWCISRQRAWGVPIPLFVHKQTQALHPKHVELMEQVACLVEQEGVDAWFDLAPEILIGNDAEHYEKVTDVLDVWFDSGSTHHAVLSSGVWPELQFPADLYLEGSDQYRGWFQSSLLTSVAIHNQSPYKINLTHGFTVDEQGRKMSKSLGNVIEPEKIISTSGADILRLWVASTDYSAEMALSNEILTRTSDAYRRIRNTARYLLSNLFDFEPNKDLVMFENLLELDRWALTTTQSYQKNIVAEYEQFAFHKAVQYIHHFCSIELGSFYLDVTKDRQYTCKSNSIARRSAQTAMYHIVHAMVRWMAPILCFTADEIWQYLPGNAIPSVHLTTWYDALNTLPENTVLRAEDWDIIMNVRNAVNKQLEIQRQQGIIGSGLEAEVVLFAGPELKALLDKLGDELRFILITSDAKVLSLSEMNIDAIDAGVDDLQISVLASSHAKCERCWHRREDVNTHAEYPGICGRCVENVAGAGEVRKFA